MSRPMTSRLDSATITLILCYAPAHAAEHLVHAWNALDATDRPEQNRAYARNRLACAKSEPVARAVKPRQRAAYEAEVAELERALVDSVAPTGAA